MFNTASETTVICHHRTWNLMASEACFHTKQLFQKGLSSSLLLWFISVSNKDALLAVSESINYFCHPSCNRAFITDCTRCM